jgi:hypothetical protein
MQGFAIAGSSLIGMNGLYERIDRDDSLGYNAGIYYRNDYSGWSMLAAVTTFGSQHDWLFLDETGRGRFRQPAVRGFLPSDGEDWLHLHDQEEYDRLKKGDPALTRNEEPGSYEQGESGIIKRVKQPEELSSLQPEGIFVWKADSDGAEHSVAGHELKKHVTPKHFKAPADGPESARTEVVGLDDSKEEVRDDKAELPWQIIGLQQVDDRMREEWRGHQEEVSVGGALFVLGGILLIEYQQIIDSRLAQCFRALRFNLTPYPHQRQHL